MKPYCCNCKFYKHSDIEPECLKGNKKFGYLLVRPCFVPGVEGEEIEKHPLSILKKPRKLDVMRCHKTRKTKR